MKNDRIYRRIKHLFPTDPEDQNSSVAQKQIKEVLAKKSKKNHTRYSGKYDRDTMDSLVSKYAVVNENGERPLSVLRKITRDLFSGVPRWRSPEMFYNVCAPTNFASSAIYAVSLEENIHGVNDVLAGATLVAERSVTRIMSELAELHDDSYGIFTFGGTGTNLYGMKLGIKKCAPESTFTGLDGNIRFLLTEDAHFCHVVGVDWLGVGLDNAEKINAHIVDRSSDINDAGNKARRILKEGHKLATIVVNGGTTYSHTIDDIEQFVMLRDRLVEEFGLSYKPHLHVDSVIGWSWLVFKGYDFEKNPMRISSPALEAIQQQYKKIAQVKLADSWGIDFHKGIGSVPATSSMIIINNAQDASLLSKKISPKMEPHQLAGDMDTLSPADYTLETTRSAGAPLSALVAIKTIGMDGFRRNLANLVESAFLLRTLFSKEKSVTILNGESLGFVTMVQIVPINFKQKRVWEYSTSELGEINSYILRFFNWDKETRVDKVGGAEYSISSCYYKNQDGVNIAAIKFYPTSPHVNSVTIKNLVSAILKQKKIFDEIYGKSNVS